MIADLVRSSGAGRVLDLAGGNGSLGAALAEAVPGVRITVVDKDPVLLALGRDTLASNAFDFVEADIAVPGWADGLGTFDAVVSTTALHWLRPGALVELYRDVAELLSAGVLFANGDHLESSEPSPLLRRVSEADDRQQQADAFGAGADDWDQWWAAVAASGRYDTQLAHREQVWGADLHTPTPKVSVGLHLAALRSAGFLDVGTAWQYLNDYVVYGER